MQFPCIGRYARLVKVCYGTIGIFIDLLWPSFITPMTHS